MGPPTVLGWFEMSAQFTDNNDISDQRLVSVSPSESCAVGLVPQQEYGVWPMGFEKL